MFAAVATITFVTRNLAVSVYIHTVKKIIISHIKYNWFFKYFNNNFYIYECVWG